MKYPEFIYANFMTIYICGDICMLVYMCENDSIWTVHPIEFRFGVYIIDHRCTTCIDFGKCRTLIHMHVYRNAKRILIHYCVWIKIIKSMLATKWSIRWSSNLVYISCVPCFHFLYLRDFCLSFSLNLAFLCCQTPKF